MDSNHPIDTAPGHKAGVPGRQLRRRLRSWLGTALLSLGVATAGCIAAPAAGATTGQPLPTWTELQPGTSPPALDGAASAYDPATRQLVLFGGETDGTASGATWVWGGSSWSEVATSGPPALIGASIAYDDSDSTLYLYGGSGSSGDSNETWAWNGSVWSQVQSSTSPPALANASLAYDQATESLVLFGGRSAGGYRGATWTFANGDWTKSIASGPSARADASMAFDAGTGQIVLFGGQGSSGDLGDTWVGTGTSWSELNPTSSPSPTSSASMDFDPATGQLLLFGGETESTGVEDQTWAYNGSTWIEQGPVTSPTGRVDATMVYDEGTDQMVLYGGNSGGGTDLSDTWTWAYPQGFVPATWTQLTPATSPSARDTSMAYDEATGQLVLFGGLGTGNSVLDDTWTWDGSTWIEQQPATSPSSPDSNPAMAYDPDTGQLVLFGGASSDGQTNDTWTWNGSDWTQLFPATSPSSRNHSSMAFDPNLGELVLFSGYPLADDTWAWNGTDWTQLSPSSSPPERYAASMTTDPTSAQAVLFGGIGSNTFGDTWTWNGTTWTDQDPSTSPSARGASAFAYDPAIGQAVLFGGNDDPGTAYSDTWTWNGTNWTQQSPSTSPSARDAAAMAYDEGTGQLVLFGGYGNGELGDTWIYGSPVVAPAISSAASTVFEVGQAGSFTITATGTPAPTFSLSGAPSWLTLNSTTGVLTGTPPAGIDGLVKFTVEASNGVGSASQAFKLQVDASPAITSAASTTFAVGSAGSFTLSATGYPKPTFSEAGALPAGVSFTKTGVLSGTPEAGTSGVYPLTVKAKNNVVPAATQDFTLRVTAPPAITSKANYTFSTEETGTFVVVATGTPTPAITESGTLPKGVTFTDEGNGEGILTGVPAFNSAGTYPISFTASNANGSTTQNFVLTVATS
jgi:hypothetical protein